VQFTALIGLFAQEFFFKNQIGAQSEYDATKIQLLNLLYCAGDEKTKLGLLYDLVMGPEQSKTVKPTDEQIVKRLECLVIIPTLLMANIIELQNKLSAKVEAEKVLLEELERVQLLLVDSANSQLREFAGMISREFFFTAAFLDPGLSGGQSRRKDSGMLSVLSKHEFVEKNLALKFKICRPTEIRQRFLKMLEAKVSIMRNSINFTMVNNLDSVLVGRAVGSHEHFGEFNFNSQEDEEDELG